MTRATISLFYAEQKINSSLLQAWVYTGVHVYHELLEKNIEDISVKCHHYLRSSKSCRITTCCRFDLQVAVDWSHLTRRTITKH